MTSRPRPKREPGNDKGSSSGDSAKKKTTRKKTSSRGGEASKRPPRVSRPPEMGEARKAPVKKTTSSSSAAPKSAPAPRAKTAPRQEPSHREPERRDAEAREPQRREPARRDEPRDAAPSRGSASRDSASRDSGGSDRPSASRRDERDDRSSRDTRDTRTPRDDRSRDSRGDRDNRGRDDARSEPREQREPRRDDRMSRDERPARDDRAQRDDRGSRDRDRDDRHSSQPPRRDEPRRDDARRDEPRRDEPRRDDSRRDRNDRDMRDDRSRRDREPRPDRDRSRDDRPARDDRGEARRDQRDDRPRRDDRDHRNDRGADRDRQPRRDEPRRDDRDRSDDRGFRQDRDRRDERPAHGDAREGRGSSEPRRDDRGHRDDRPRRDDRDHRSDHDGRQDRSRDQRDDRAPRHDDRPRRDDRDDRPRRDERGHERSDRDARSDRDGRGPRSGEPRRDEPRREQRDDRSSRDDRPRRDDRDDGPRNDRAPRRDEPRRDDRQRDHRDDHRRDDRPRDDRRDEPRRNDRTSDRAGDRRESRDHRDHDEPRNGPRADREPHRESAATEAALQRAEAESNRPPQAGPPSAGFNKQAYEETFERGIRFADLGLSENVLRGVTEAGFEHPTSIQAKIIPTILTGQDVLGQAKTGTGKTAAFALPMLSNVERGGAYSGLVLVPTRELALQVASDFRELGKHTGLRVQAVYGGQSINTQAEQLRKGPEIIVATPGRIMDMVQRGYLHYQNVKMVVLDEVDRMLDIGFRDDIRKILSACPEDRQTVFVSATLTPEIESLAKSFANDIEKIVASAGALTVALVKQLYLAVEPWDKKHLLKHLLTHEQPALTIVFCRTKKTVDNLTEFLNRGGITAHAIHGDMYQAKRNKVIEQLRGGKLSVLIASDLASRGLDVEGITHVINYDLPEDPDLYVHRIGRTARAGRDGIAWSLVTPEQGELLTQIELLINAEIPKMDYPDFVPGPVPSGVRAEKEQAQKRVAEARSFNRFQMLPPTSAASSAMSGAGQADKSKFPGGVVPSKLPPRVMQGKVKTRGGLKQAIAQARKNEPPANPSAPAPAPAPEPDTE